MFPDGGTCPLINNPRCMLSFPLKMSHQLWHALRVADLGHLALPSTDVGVPWYHNPSPVGG